MAYIWPKDGQSRVGVLNEIIYSCNSRQSTSERGVKYGTGLGRGQNTYTLRGKKKLVKGNKVQLDFEGAHKGMKKKNIPDGGESITEIW